MLTWITENTVTILAIAAVLLVIGLAVFSLVKEKKHKTGGCTGNCATCGMGCSSGEKKS